MEKSVQALFDEQILGESARRFDLEPDTLKLISDMENFVYGNDSEENPCILRITHSSHRTLEALMGEIEWMEYLRVNKVPVSSFLRSVKGELVERIPTGDSYFLVTAFQRLPGKTILESDQCTTETYQKWGQILGRMHALAKTFHPSQPAYKRGEWFTDDLAMNAGKYIPGQADILDRHHDLLRYLHSLPKDGNSYGLIHADFTDMNFFVHEGQLAVFDFDDCLYHWFIYDIAVILYDLPWLPHGEMPRDEFARYFWGHFFQGYAWENTLDPSWLNCLGKFLKLRELNIYLVYSKKWGSEDLSEGRRTFLEELKQKIASDTPCLELESLFGQPEA